MTEPMNPAQIAAMVADCEAGTPGPWTIFTNETVRMDMPRIVRYGEAGLSICKTHLIGGCDHDPSRANARRIARVPDLEATVIAQAAKIKRLEMVADYDKRRADNLELVRDRLNAEIARLTDALRFYADFYESPNDGPWGVNSTDFGTRARAALGETL